MPDAQTSNNVFSGTTAGTNAGATATVAAVAGKTHIIRHLSGHTDTDSLLQLLGGAAGTTVLWESKIDISVEGFSFCFNLPDGIVGTPGATVAGKVASSTTDCQVNIAGYSFP